MQSDGEPVFGPWYEYLSTLETVFLLGMAVAMVTTFWTGLTDPGTDFRASVGLAGLFAGFIAFFVRWSVSERRTAAHPALEEEY